MIAIDTNIIVRFLTHDNEEQFQASRHLFETGDLFVADTVILETEWVLRYAYEYSPADICTAFRKLFGMKNVYPDNPEKIAQAIDWHKRGLDFADALHLSLSDSHDSFKTFDEKLIKRATNLTFCKVDKP